MNNFSNVIEAYKTIFTDYPDVVSTEQAAEMLFQLVKQLAKQEGVTEELKRRDQMAWVGMMNNIRNRAEAIINSEVLFV